MCVIIDIETGHRRDTEKPSPWDFLVARFGPGFCISSDCGLRHAAGCDGDIVTIDAAFEALDDYETRFGAHA